MSSALIVVDMQEDFVNPDGSLYVPGAEKIVHDVNRATELYSKITTVIYTSDQHSIDDPSFQKNGGKWPVRCVKGSKGAELYQGLKVFRDSLFLEKGTKDSIEDGYSAFGGNIFIHGKYYKLDTILNNENINHIYVCGVATEYCVNETIKDALKFGFRVTVILDCVAGIDKDKCHSIIQSWKAKGVSFLKVI